MTDCSIQKKLKKYGTQESLPYSIAYKDLINDEKIIFLITELF